MRRKRRQVYDIDIDEEEYNRPLIRRRLMPQKTIQTWGKPTGERKGTDTTLTYAAVVNTTTTNDNIVCVNLLQNGAGSNNRIGRKIAMHSLKLNINLYYYQAITGQTTATWNMEGNLFRCVVLYDRQPSNGAALPVFNTVFGTLSEANVEDSNTFDPLKYENMSRYKVLRDQVVEINPTAVRSMVNWGNNPPTEDYACACTMRKNVSMYIPLNGLQTVYSGSSNPMTYDELTTGSLLVVFRCLVNAQSSFVSIEASSSARLRFYDA